MDAKLIEHYKSNPYDNRFDGLFSRLVKENNKKILVEVYHMHPCDSVFEKIFGHLEDGAIQDLIKTQKNINREEFSDVCSICRCVDDIDKFIDLRCRGKENRCHHHYYCINCFERWYRTSPKICLLCTQPIHIKSTELIILK
jgi:hypothetical protein